MPYDAKTAKETMRRFYDRVRKEDKGSSDTVDKNQYSTLHVDAAIRLQRQFRRRKDSTKLSTKQRSIQVDNEVYGKDVLDFLGREKANPKLKRSIDFVKTKKLANALNQGDWQDEILAVAPDVPGSIQPYIEMQKLLGNRLLSPKNRATDDQRRINLPFSMAIKKENGLSSDEQLMLYGAAYENRLIDRNEFFQFLNKNNFLLEMGITRIDEVFDEEGEIQADPLYFLSYIVETISDDKRTALEQLFGQIKAADVSILELRQILQNIMQSLPISPHLFYAMSAYTADLISREQFDTVLTRHELYQNFGNNIQILTFINDDGSFTEEAKKYFAQLLAVNKENEKFFLNEESLEKFRLNLLALPKSERVGFIFDATPWFDLNVPDQNLLDEKIYYNLSLFASGNKYMSLATGAVDALGVAMYGPDRYANAEPKLGKFTVSDIEDSVIKGMRLKATHYPNAYQTYFVHDRFLTLFGGGYLHDNIHASVMSKLPIEINNSLTYLKEVLRKASNISISKEIWITIDRSFFDIVLTLSPDYIPDTYSKMFFNILIGVSGFRSEEEHFASDSSDDKAQTALQKLLVTGNVTLLAFAIDIAHHPEQWQNKKIYLHEIVQYHPLATLLENTKKISPYIKNDLPDLQVIKLAFYSHFNATHQQLTEPVLKQLFALLKEAKKFNLIEIFKKRPPDNLLKITHLDYVADSKTDYICKINLQDFMKNLSAEIEAKKSQTHKFT